MFFRLQHAAAADGAAGGGGAAGGAAAGAAAGPAGGAAGGTAGGGAPAGGTILAGGQAANLEWLSDKYHVKTADGKIDEAASIRKQAEAYTPLSKRMVDVGLPPEKPEAYKLELPADVKDVKLEDFAKDANTQAFLKGAHAAGMTDKQVNFAIAHYMKVAPQLAGAGGEISAEEATTQLRTVWKTDADFKQNASSAYRASASLASVAGLTYDDIEAAGLGNNPVFLRLMAALGKEMSEDTTPNGDAPGGAGGTFEEQTQALRKQLEAMPLHDAKRKGLQEQLDALYSKKYGSQRTAFSFQKTVPKKQ